VVITTAQMYQEQQATTLAVTSLGVKLDALSTALVAESVKGTSDHGDHESRIRALERARWPLASLTVLIALGALAVALVQMAGGH
jgi:hypothetical protein